MMTETEGSHCARATVKSSCTHEQDQEFTQPGKEQVNSLLIPLQLWYGRLPGHTAFVKGCKKSARIHFPLCGLFIQVTYALDFSALQGLPTCSLQCSSEGWSTSEYRGREKLQEVGVALEKLKRNCVDIYEKTETWLQTHGNSCWLAWGWDLSCLYLSCWVGITAQTEMWDSE